MLDRCMQVAGVVFMVLGCGLLFLHQDTLRPECEGFELAVDNAVQSIRLSIDWNSHTPMSDLVLGGDAPESELEHAANQVVPEGYQEHCAVYTNEQDNNPLETSHVPPKLLRMKLRR